MSYVPIHIMWFNIHYINIIYVINKSWSVRCNVDVVAKYVKLTIKIAVRSLGW